MADTVLDYNATLNIDNDLSDDLVEEEEYDAKNDETFGELDNTFKEDWEQQHEDFADLEEISKLTIALDLEIPSLFEGSVWSYKEETPKNEVKQNDGFKSITQPLPRKICTVEELERNLLTSKTKQQHGGFPPVPTVLPPPRYPPLYQPPMPSRVPPGLPPPMRPMPPLGPYNVPPGVMRVIPPPPFISNSHPPGMMFRGNSQFPVGHPFNFPPLPHRNIIQQNKMCNNRRHESSNGFHRHREERDEYAGLMTNREKQWLLNIQLLQLNTGTPYFDDYYYTVFKSRRASKKPERPIHYNNRHRNNERQDNPLTPKVYTPLQFENSLGKLQCGSVTAPRKIIDMDVVSQEKDADAQPVAKDTRKNKQVLLEIEAMYSLFLKAVDLKNPLAIGDTEKLHAMKQKQRLRELDAAPTPEQKQEVLELLRKESKPIVEDQNECLQKIVHGLLREEKFGSYFRVSKGKMLVLRVLPHLPTEIFAPQLRDLWTRILLSIPQVGRRDTMGDNVLPRFYPVFKSHCELFEMSELLELVGTLAETTKQDNSRGTPCPVNQGKSPLHPIILNKFGISALCALIVRSEVLLSTNRTTEKQMTEWGRFVATFADVSQSLINAAAGETSVPPAPIERIPREAFARHADRLSGLGTEKRSLLERMLVDTNPLLNVYFS